MTGADDRVPNCPPFASGGFVHGPAPDVPLDLHQCTLHVSTDQLERFRGILGRINMPDVVVTAQGIRTRAQQLAIDAQPVVIEALPMPGFPDQLLDVMADAARKMAAQIGVPFRRLERDAEALAGRVSMLRVLIDDLPVQPTTRRGRRRARGKAKGARR